ncbi:unnamed protein product [Effrenium voratum]|nr:unnamed protein product [Effrenium voratum]
MGLARVFFRTQQGTAGAWALQLTAPASFGFTSPCAVQDGPTDRAAGPSRVGDTPRPRRG